MGMNGEEIDMEIEKELLMEKIIRHSTHIEEDERLLMKVGHLIKRDVKKEFMKRLQEQKETVLRSYKEIR